MRPSEEASAAHLLTQWADRAERNGRPSIKIKPSTARKFAAILLSLDHERHKHERERASYAGKDS